MKTQQNAYTHEESVERMRTSLLTFIPLFHRHLSQVFHGSEGYGCTKNQNKAIFIIKNLGRINPSALGKFLDMRRGSLTTLVDSLESQKLVTREDDPEDRRKQWLSLTENGENYVLARYKHVEEKLSELFENRPDTEREQFVLHLEQLVEIMKKL